ncbi:MAG: hypothetical protein ACK47M_06755 [Caldilinea sp.]
MLAQLLTPLLLQCALAVNSIADSLPMLELLDFDVEYSAVNVYMFPKAHKLSDGF